jgi:uncharacterized protein
MRCPICKKQFDPSEPVTRSPFCSERCKLIDLGRWLDGAYQIPVEDDDPSDDYDDPAMNPPQLPPHQN